MSFPRDKTPDRNPLIEMTEYAKEHNPAVYSFLISIGITLLSGGTTESEVLELLCFAFEVGETYARETSRVVSRTLLSSTKTPRVPQ
jgi:hypothetical protein